MIMIWREREGWLTLEYNCAGSVVDKKESNRDEDANDMGGNGWYDLADKL